MSDLNDTGTAPDALPQSVGSVTPTTNHPKKWVECLDCSGVMQITAFIPLKLSCCGQCGSLKIRLYKPMGKSPNAEMRQAKGDTRP